MEQFAFSQNLNFLEIMGQEKVNKQVNSSFDNRASTFNQAQNCSYQILTLKD